MCLGMALYVFILFGIKKIIYLFGCTRYSLQYVASLILMAACGIFSCNRQTPSYSVWDLDPWTGIEPWPLNWERVVLATGPTGKSQFSLVLIMFLEPALNSFHQVLKTPLLLVVVYLLSPVWLFCDHMYCSHPGSSVHGNSQARTLDRVAISFSRGSSWPRDGTHIFCITGGFFTTEPLGKPTKPVHLQVLFLSHYHSLLVSYISSSYILSIFPVPTCLSWSVLVQTLQSDRTNGRCIGTARYRELFHVTMEPGKSKSSRVSLQAQDSQKRALMIQFMSKDHQQAECILA